MACYAFGPYVLDLNTRRLLRDEQQLEITAKTFEMLAALVQNRGRVVTKDELLKMLWPDTVVEEANLAQNISTLRRILHDTPKERRFIATIPGRGYSFVAPVVEQPLSFDEHAPKRVQNADGISVTTKPRFAFRSGYIVVAVSVAILLACLVIFRPGERRKSSTFYSSVPLTGYG